MKLYNMIHDKRPVAVSSAHWNDARACSSDAPLFEAMYHLPTLSNPALAHSFHHTDSLFCNRWSGLSTSGCDIPHVSRNPFKHHETQ